MRPQVRAGNYPQFLIHLPKLQTVGEPTQQRTANIGMNNRKPLRRPLDRREPPVELSALFLGQRVEARVGLKTVPELLDGFNSSLCENSFRWPPPRFPTLTFRSRATPSTE